MPRVLVRSVALGNMQMRSFSSRRNPWGQNGNNDWITTAKTGALVVIGAGVLVASTSRKYLYLPHYDEEVLAMNYDMYIPALTVVLLASVAFGLIIAGAAGYGVYSLYQKVFGPYRSRQSPGDLFSGVNSDIDRLSELFGRRKQPSAGEAASSSTSGAMGQRELDSLVQGLPLVVRGLVKTIFSFVGKAMQSSMQRAGELRRLANEHIQSHPRVVSQMGSGVSVSTPQQWMESSEYLCSL